MLQANGRRSFDLIVPPAPVVRDLFWGWPEVLRKGLPSVNASSTRSAHWETRFGRPLALEISEISSRRILTWSQERWHSDKPACLSLASLPSSKALFPLMLIRAAKKISAADPRPCLLRLVMFFLRTFPQPYVWSSGSEQRPMPCDLGNESIWLLSFLFVSFRSLPQNLLPSLHACDQFCLGLTIPSCTI